MNGLVVMQLQAKTLPEAVELAATRWREIMDDPMAELPWSTHYQLTDTELAGELEVKVTIDFDRNMVDSVASD